MKNKYTCSLFRNQLLALTLASGVAQAGTTESATELVPSISADWLNVSGYAGIAYTNIDDGTETFADGGSPFDAAKVGFTGDFGSLGAYTSLFYTPGVAGDEAGILDAYMTYKTGDLTFTAGKYLSYLGYEAFDLVNMSQITYANGLGAIPAYHMGLKMDYSTDVWGAGVNVSDSIRGGTGFWEGDEDFGNGLGYEAYVSYKGIDKLTIWAGLGIDDTDGLDTWQTYDLWASYDLTDKLTIAGEIAYHESGLVEGVQGLAFAKYSFTDNFSTAFRVGFDSFDTGGNDTNRYTISPTYVFTENFLLRAEVTYNQFDVGGDSIFSGAQAVLTF